MRHIHSKSTHTIVWLGYPDYVKDSYAVRELAFAVAIAFVLGMQAAWVRRLVTAGPFTYTLLSKFASIIFEVVWIV
jgi:hypothetical protein